MDSKKCSSKRHEETDAILFCQECNIFLCNKCEIHHSEIFQDHHQFKLDKNLDDIFTGFCKEDKHREELDYFCKSHNQLCCSSCITKIKGKKKGQHSECDVCFIEDIKEVKKNKLNDNIKLLEELSKELDNSINQLKIIFRKMNENKEELKLNIQKLFTKIRNAVNNREDELILEIDKLFEKIYFNDNIIKLCEKLPSRVNISLEKSKEINKYWNDDKKLNSLINDCINIENNTKNIFFIQDISKKYNNFNIIKIKFVPEKEDETNNFLKTIKTFGNVFYNNLELLFSDSVILNKNRTYIEKLICWIDPKNSFQTQILYRKSQNNNSYETFHKQCDNQGTTLALIKGIEGFIIGGFTPLSWDISTNNWKKDDDTFVFSLTENKIFRKRLKSTNSIYCDKNVGIWFPYIGFRNTGKKNMSQGEFLYYSKDRTIFNDFNKIIPNEGKDRFFDVEEVEVYKIVIN